MRKGLLVASLLAGVALAQEKPAEPAPEAQAPRAPAAEAAGGIRAVAGMSILGNEEAPKSLVIVPWKSSRIGDGVGVKNALDDRATAVDKDVFMRELRYYELRSAVAE